MLGEPEAAALRAALLRWPMLVSSSLLVVESLRVCAELWRRVRPSRRRWAGHDRAAADRRRGAPRGSDLAPSSLRSLEAIHLATALSLHDQLVVLLCYDERLATAAADAGVVVLAPR